MEAVNWEEYMDIVEARECADKVKVQDQELKLNYFGKWSDTGVCLSTGVNISHGELWEIFTPYKYMCRLSNVVLSDGRCLVGYGSVKMQRCLELGCDWGHCFPVFENYFDEVHGIEVQKWAVDMGVKNGYNIIHGLMEYTPYKDNFFDVVLSNHVLEHGISAKVVLGEVYRVTKVGGWSIHTLPCRLDLVLNIPTESSIHQTELTWRQWCDVFHEVGFSIDKLYWSWNHNQEEVNFVLRKL